MRIEARGVLNPSEPGGRRAVSSFGSLTVLPGGSLLATYRVGSSKDCDDETVELRWSHDLGASWTAAVSPFGNVVDGVHGSLRVVYVTCLAAGNLLACGLWVDRESHPGALLFNHETEGCLPMKIVLANSSGQGRTWTPWRTLPVTADIGPPSLTNPVLRFAGGRLAVSIESNKEFNDRSPWFQKVVYVESDDNGATWNPPRLVCQDPEARVFNWDQRAALAPDGRLATFSWVYHRESAKYANIWRRISADEGHTWTGPDDLGFSDQPSHPAILSDGRVVLAWVDRYGTNSIRARSARSLDEPFHPETEVVLHEAETTSRAAGNTGEMLDDMARWSYGLPFAEPLPNGREVIVVYYAGTPAATSIDWVRLSV
ncbi:MAG: sialidase family protein [Acidobacteria bacterium]|nr:sialidase family protein [Acidobacteriota bacterium]